VKRAARGLAPALAIVVVVGVAAPVSGRPHWKNRIDRLVAPYNAGVAFADDGRALYSHDATRRRALASNQKLLLSLALFDVLGARDRISTAAAAKRVRRGVIPGDLWVLGHGDPSIASGAGYGEPLTVRATPIVGLAHKIRASGVRRVDGRVMGSTGYFARDWNAKGWEPYVPSRFAPLPSALAYDGNSVGGIHIHNPERRFAAALQTELERIGVEVGRGAGAGRAPRNLDHIAVLRSAPLFRLVQYMNHESSNFFAEMLGKRLGATVYGRPGTIAKGASAIRSWAETLGVAVRSYDSSGLSYDDRMAPAALVRLLEAAGREPRLARVRRSLPRPGEGTLAGRLGGVDARAKTGTHLNGDSALSGWVRLRHGGRWVEFSILSVGMPKVIEDAIVRIVAGSARTHHRWDLQMDPGRCFPSWCN
jgi:serine-type D-Ala-D-Ala carboxypeptidase/endopeptidase (penicillin-binding protein 4)